jgi:hypothetical protein
MNMCRNFKHSLRQNLAFIYIYDNIKRKKEKIKRKIKREIICEPFVFLIETIKYKVREDEKKNK